MQDESSKLVSSKVAADGGPAMGHSIADLAPKASKQKIQITWTDIHIKAMPPTGRCKAKNALKEPKPIINGVSGTVMPGQFVAIIGASGKY